MTPAIDPNGGRMVEHEWRSDGWGAEVRIGLLTPAADLGPEAEINAMVPPTITVHAARVPFAAMAAGGRMDPTIALQAVKAFAEPPGVDDAVGLLAFAPLSVIGFGFTSSAYVIGRDGEEQMCRRLRERAEGIPVVSTGAAMAQAATVLGARRIALVSPPWFDEQLTSLGAEYFTSAGLEVVAAASCSLPSDQRAIAPEALHGWVTANTPTDADAVLIGGNGFRAVGAIDALEQDLGRPVVTANQALLWACMTTAECSTSIEHYGRLLR